MTPHKRYSKKTNLKITILEILVYRTQPDIIKSKIFTRVNYYKAMFFISKPWFILKLKRVKILDFII